MIKMPNFEGARDYAIGRLETELSPNLTYHCSKHTTEEVVPAADRLAHEENIGGDERLLLLIGAYYHDLGFIHQRQDHESISIQLAERKLPMFGFNNSQIAIIRGIIQSTHMPQSPTNILEKIMADADLVYLGAENYWKRSNDLRQELENYGANFTDEDWYHYQLNFIREHQYFTKTQQLLGEASKHQHLVEIQTRLRNLVQLNQS